ncbi:MAG: aminopeptidase, partial [Verrucomicrobiota bacterium]
MPVLNSPTHMADPRHARLAKLLVEYSCALRRGESVLFDMIDVPDDITVALMRAAREVGASPLVEVRHTRVIREMQRGTTEAHARLVRDVEMARMRRVDAYVAIRGALNSSETSDVPA